MTEIDIENVRRIYNNTYAQLNNALVGQESVKNALTAAILCDPNSKILLTSGPGYGKTSLSEFLASSFNSSKIVMTSDTIPLDIINQLLNNLNLEFLHIDEFNRANGKALSALLEFLAQRKITIEGKTHSFNDFYVLATQNENDIAGTFNVPAANYDRFDINVPFEPLSEEDLRQILFSFQPSNKSDIRKEDIAITSSLVADFIPSEEDQEILLKAFDIINRMTIDGKSVFDGSNVRGHMYTLKLAKLMAMYHARNYILPIDIVPFLQNVYMHRANQRVVRTNMGGLRARFGQAKEDIMKLKRVRK